MLPVKIYHPRKQKNPLGAQHNEKQNQLIKFYVDSPGTPPRRPKRPLPTFVVLPGTQRIRKQDNKTG